VAVDAVDGDGGAAELGEPCKKVSGEGSTA